MSPYVLPGAVFPAEASEGGQLNTLFPRLLYCLIQASPIVLNSPSDADQNPKLIKQLQNWTDPVNPKICHELTLTLNPCGVAPRRAGGRSGCGS